MILPTIIMPQGEIIAEVVRLPARVDMACPFRTLTPPFWPSLGRRGMQETPGDPAKEGKARRMDSEINPSDPMPPIEVDARRFGDSLPAELVPGRSGNGWMIWDDDSQCIFLDFFGTFEPGERSRAAKRALEIYEGLRLPYSLRIGFHPSEAIARRTMLDWMATASVD